MASYHYELLAVQVAMTEQLERQNQQLEEMAAAQDEMKYLINKKAKTKQGQALARQDKVCVA